MCYSLFLGETGKVLLGDSREAVMRNAPGCRWRMTEWEVKIRPLTVRGTKRHAENQPLSSCAGGRQ